MKNSILLIVGAIAIIFLLPSQIKAQAKLTQGTSVVQLGVGLGSSTDAYTSSESPLVTLTYQRGIKDNLGKGNLSIGGTIAAKSGQSVGLGYEWDYNYFAIAGRASYHPHFIRSEKFDAYAGLSLGLHTMRVDSNFDFGIDISYSELILAGHIGGRYQFNDNWAAYGEIGYGLGVLNVGVAYKF